MKKRNFSAEFKRESAQLVVDHFSDPWLVILLVEVRLG